MRAVLDPNVLVSAAISPAGPPRQILTAWIDERFELIASPSLLDELADVLARPKFRRFITTIVATEFTDGLATDAAIIADPPALPGVSPDPTRLPRRARAGRRGLPRVRRSASPRPDRPGPAGTHAAAVPRPSRHRVVMRVAVIADVNGDLDTLRSLFAAIDRMDAELIWCRAL